jgi:hypothetical protein
MRLNPLVTIMADEEALTKDESRVWEYIKKHDFEGNPWITPAVAKDLKMDDQAVYEALAEINKKKKGEIYIYYKDGALRIATE